MITILVDVLVGLAVWLLVGLAVALAIGPVLRKRSDALERADTTGTDGE